MAKLVFMIFLYFYVEITLLNKRSTNKLEEEFSEHYKHRSLREEEVPKMNKEISHEMLELVTKREDNCKCLLGND